MRYESVINHNRLVLEKYRAPFELERNPLFSCFEPVTDDEIRRVVHVQNGLEPCKDTLSMECVLTLWLGGYLK